MKVIIKQVKECVPSAVLRVRIYQPIVEAFDDLDWDTRSECLGGDVAFDEVLREAHPDLFDDEDDDDDDLDEVDDDLDDLDDEDDEEDLDDIDDDDDDEEED